MKKHFACIVAIFLCLEGGFSQELLIKINTADCVNCIINMVYLKNIDSKISVKMLFKASEKQLAQKIMNELIPIEWNDIDVLYSDSLYAKTSRYNASSCYLLQEDSIVFCCLLSELQENISSINAYAICANEIEVCVPKGELVLSKRIMLHTTDENLYLLDVTFNTLYEICHQGPARIVSYKAQDLFDLNFVHTFFSKTSRDRFSSVASQMKALKKWDMLMENIWIKKDSVFLLCSYFLPVEKNKGRDLLIEKKFVIAKFYEGGVKEMFPIKDYSLGEYDIDQTNAFFEHDGNWYLSIFKDHETPPNYPLAIYHKNNKGYLAKASVLKNKLPDSISKNIYALNKAIFREGRVFYTQFNFYYDVKIGNYVHYILEPSDDHADKSKKSLVKHKLLEVFKMSGLWGIVHAKDGEVTIHIVDENGRAIAKRKTQIDTQTLSSNFSYANNLLFWVSDDHEIKKIKLNKQ
ncbi:MAG: hypothetical protein KF734_21435 [Saprospiraceae bacterium]|nr:hypothetical protein [Saprospiraceae bacterium]